MSQSLKCGSSISYYHIISKQKLCNGGGLEFVFFTLFYI